MEPLIFFVHVPKTAGSTVNAHLKMAMPNGKMHCESIINNETLLKAAAETLDWMSGHINLSTAQSRLAAVTDRPVRYFACMREPTRQVASHYNWLIEIHAKGRDFYERHPKQIKEISQRIRSTDNSTAAGIISALLKSPGLFLNFQARTVLGPDFRWLTGRIYQQLEKYEMVCTEEKISELVARMTGQPAVELSTKNASPYHFDRTLFDTEEMRDFLRKNNTLDYILYGLVRDL